jgi:rhodanese-related sulfurtransferase
MRKRTWLHTFAEIILIVAVSAAAGIAWNRTLLASAWRGELTEQRQATPAGDELPMPVGLAQVKELYDGKGAVIVDARSAADFARGHIAGALEAPLQQARTTPSRPLPGRIAKDATIVAYCNGFSCHDSMELGKLLMRAGYGQVYVYEGGFPEWRDAGYPTAAGAK